MAANKSNELFAEVEKLLRTKVSSRGKFKEVGIQIVYDYRGKKPSMALRVIDQPGQVVVRTWEK